MGDPAPKEEAKLPPALFWCQNLRAQEASCPLLPHGHLAAGQACPAHSSRARAAQHGFEFGLMQICWGFLFVLLWDSSLAGN